MVKAKNNSSDSDTVTTIMSGIPAHMAVQERQQQPINELEAVVQSNSRNCGGGRGGGSGGSGRSWRQEAGGRRQEAGGRRQEAVKEVVVAESTDLRVMVHSTESKQDSIMAMITTVGHIMVMM
jgi:hypothetical protein